MDTPVVDQKPPTGRHTHSVETFDHPQTYCGLGATATTRAETLTEASCPVCATRGTSLLRRRLLRVLGQVRAEAGHGRGDLTLIPRDYLRHYANLLEAAMSPVLREDEAAEVYQG